TACNVPISKDSRAVDEGVLDEHFFQPYPVQAPAADRPPFAVAVSRRAEEVEPCLRTGVAGNRPLTTRWSRPTWYCTPARPPTSPPSTTAAGEGKWSCSEPRQASLPSSPGPQPWKRLGTPPAPSWCVGSTPTACQGTRPSRGSSRRSTES